MEIKYRPEVDGLRTISVMLVIFHHLGWEFFSGGYIGVDIFFVISGYLITSIITKDIQKGSFSISDFYKRRVIRIAPAYFLVLIITSIVSTLILLPAELTNYFKSANYSILFSANFYMWQEVGGYFGSQSNIVPLLHLWSLAVEEQFYILWPPILIISLRLIKIQNIWIPLSLAILGTVYLSEWGVQNYRAASYYLMPTRVFELLIGALINFLPKINWSAKTRNTLGIIGLGIILFPATILTKDSLFPGVSALFPCIGAFSILFFCKESDDIVGRILARRFMVSIGKISYPAYLWHWPIIAYLNIYKIEFNVLISLAVLAATFTLAYLTYLYIETPIKRLNTHSSGKVIGFGFCLPALSIFFASSIAQANQGWPSRFQESLNIKSAALKSWTHKMRGRCNEGPPNNPLPEDSCVLGLKDRPVDFLLIGDSHANHFTSMINIMAKDAGLRGYDITQSQTIFLPETKSFQIQGRKRVEILNFEIRNQKLKKIIEERKYKAVVLGGSFANYYINGDFQSSNNKDSKKVFETKFKESIELIENSGSSVFIIKGSPFLKEVQYDCDLSNERFSTTNSCKNSLELHRKHFEKWETFLMGLKLEHPTIKIIDPTKIICNEKYCNTQINGIPLYRDNNHLNHMGSELIGNLYIEKLGNPLKSIN